ncbi:hypothetical protein EBAPG3_010555 [Nitrosospira lacus]|uniref:Bacteriophage tail tape measure N-terminal domain-containing protein n=1 Tax=Nitrosospira lacus TaxID=1288494 RepID=A0A1W6SQX1_9PROT|nr:phage tail length tape measure family protein [Nitrosospira lacus]ARO88183.1 hypothetical protein EBAPG3_010555 [Nitrosospira lacus]
MNDDLNVGIKITADGKGVIGETRKTEEAIGGIGQTAKKTNAESAAAADKFTATLKRQADTLGMTKSQTLAYEASQHQLTSAQRESVAQSMQSINSYERQESILGRVSMAAKAAGAAIVVGLVAALKTSVTQSALAEQSHIRLQAVLRGTGHAAGLTKADLDAMADSMKGRLGIDDDALRDSMAVLLTFRNISRNSFGEALEVSADLAAVMQTDLKSAVLQLGKALENPDEGLTALKRSGVSFNDTQKEMIKQLVDTGRQAEAITLILSTMREQGLDKVAESMNQGMTKTIRDAGLAWDDLLKTIGGTSVVKNTVETIFGSFTTTFENMRRVIEGGDWLDRLRYFTGFGLSENLKNASGSTVAPVDTDAAAAREGLARQQAAQQAEILALQKKKAAEEAAKLSEENRKRAAQELKQEIDASNRYADALKIETEQIGLNTIQKRMLVAAAEAAKAPTEALRREIMTSAQAWATATQAEEARIATQKEQVELLEKQRKAEAALLKEQTKAAAEREKIEADAAKETAQEWNRMWGTVEQTGKMAFVQLLGHGTGAMKAIGASIKASIIDMLYQLTVRKWIINIGTSVGGVLGLGGVANASGGGGLLSTGANVLQIGKAIFDGFSGAFTGGIASLVSGAGSLFGSSAVSAFGAGMGLTGAQATAAAGAYSAAGMSGIGSALSMGSVAAAAAGPLAIAAAGVMLSNMIAGDYEIFKGSGILNFLGGIGGLINRAFGLGPKKVQAEGIQGTFSDDGFSGTAFSDWKRKGGWFRKSKFGTDTAPLSESLTDNFGKGFQALKDSGIEYAKILGLSTDAVTGYTKSIKLALTKDADENQRRIDAMFGGIADELALKLMPNIREFAQANESLGQTFARLAEESARAQVAIGQGLVTGMQRLMGLADQMASLALSDLSPLTAAQRLATAEATYATTLAQAKAGNMDAIGRLGGAAQDYLKEGRGFFASSPEYSALFANVQAAVGDLIGSQLTDSAIAITDLKVPLDAIVTNTANLDKRIGDILAAAVAARASTDAAVIKAQTEAIVRATLDAARVQVSAQQAGVLA